MTRWLNLLLLLLIVLVGLPAYWLLLDNCAEDTTAKTVDIGELRQLAQSLPGQRPTTVRYEIPAREDTPGTYLAAGSGFKSVTVGMPAFILVVPGEGAVMLDSGMGAMTAGELRVGQYDPLAQARIVGAMRQASLILATHEHGDSMGGLALISHEPLFNRARLNAGQIPSASLSRSLPWSGNIQIVPSIPSDRPSAVAPGIVVIPAPSHTPGSQMIYVRLAGGRELLFAGDISPLDANWRELRARARYISLVHGSEDRPEIYAWLRTLQRLKRQAPGLVIVPGRDLAWFSHADRRILQLNHP